MTRDERREQQVLRLLDEAESARALGRLPEALRLQGEANKLLRERAGQDPSDPRHRQMLASSLYSAGSMHTEAGQPDAAIAALDEAEERYVELGRIGHIPDVRPLVADVGLRRALALAADGRGASAVLEADAAVTGYEALVHDERSDPSGRDLARVLAVNAGILGRYGDPDVAVASADRAIRIFIGNGAATGRFEIGRAEVGYLTAAAAVAAPVHARFGRAELSLAAADFGLQFSGDDRLVQALRNVHQRVGGLTAAQRDDLGRQVAEASRGGAPPSSPEGQVLMGVLAYLAPLAGLGLLPPFPAGDELPLTTLAGALGLAGEQADLIGSITAPAVDVVITTPSHRSAAQLAPARALRLAAQAAAALPDRQAAGIRIGLEAHFLFAVASRLQVLAMRYQFREFGPPWARLLIRLSEAFEARGDLRMALDLAAWAAGAADQLLPFAHLETGLAHLARDCVVRHGQTLILSGDLVAGEAALAHARFFDDLGRR